MNKILYITLLLALPTYAMAQTKTITAPGTYDFSTAFSFGEMTQETEDYDGDGNPNYIEKYTYDENGNRIRYELDSDADGTPDGIFTYAYDAMGNRTRYESDNDGNGTINRIYTYTYNAKGKITKEEEDNDGDGIFDKIITYTYDTNGNKTKGFLGEVITYQYYNTIKCTMLSPSLAHKLIVKVTNPGYYRMELCGSSFQNVMALSSTAHCDSSIAFAQSGCASGDALFHASLDTGTYYLTIAGKGPTDKGNYTLNMVRERGLSTKEITKNTLSIFPNPATNTLTIENLNNQTAQYSIYSVTGQLVMSLTATNTIDTSSLDAGMYFIHATTGANKELVKGKFIKL